MPRCRGLNYTEREKLELLSLIAKYKHIIENKKTDSATIKKKNECWKKICNEYNSRVERPRVREQLRGCYNNLKRSKQQRANQPAENSYSEKTTYTNLVENSIYDIQFNSEPNISDETPDYFRDENNYVNYNINDNSVQTTSDDFVNILKKPKEEIEEEVQLEEPTEDDKLHEEKIIDSVATTSTSIEHEFESADKTLCSKDKLVQYTSRRKRKINKDMNLLKKYNERRIELVNIQIEHEKEEHKYKVMLLQLEVKLKQEELRRRLNDGKSSDDNVEK